VSREGFITAYSDAALTPLHSLLPDDAKAQVEPFGKVVSNVCTLLGMPGVRLAGARHMAHALEAASAAVGSDSLLAQVARFPGLREAVGSTLDELSAFDIDDVVLEKAAIHAPDYLSGWFRELATFSSAVEGSLHQVSLTRFTDLLRARDVGSQALGASMPHILVFADGKPRPAHLDWLKWAALQGCEILLVIEKAAGQPLFKLGAVPYDREVGTTGPVASQLFAEPVISKEPLGFAIWSMPDALHEVEHVLRDVGRLLASGVPEARIAIVARSATRYGPLLSSAARRFGIGLRSSAKASLIDQRLIQVILTLLSGFGSNRVREFRSLVRNSYFGIPSSLHGDAINACRAAEPNNDWGQLLEWSTQKSKTLAAVLEGRAAFVGRDLPLRDWINHLHDLILALDIVDAVPLEIADREGFIVNAAERDLYAYASMRPSAEPISLLRLATLCQRVWEGGTCSVPSEGGVRIVTSAEAVCESDVVYVVGMLEGAFPRRAVEDGILNDEARAWLREQGFATLPDSNQVAETERDEFYRLALTAPRVVFTYPTTEDDSERIPSLFLEAIKDISTCEIRDFLPSDVAGVESPFTADQRLSAALLADRVSPPPVRLEDPDRVQALFGDPPNLYSPEELRDALRCPFQHFARHRLHLKSELVRERWRSFASLAASAKVSSAPDVAVATERLTQELEQRLDRYRGVVPDWEYQLLDAGGRRIIEEIVEREFSMRADWPRSEVRFDVPLGPGPERLKVSGMVDSTFEIDAYRAVSLHQAYFRAPKEGDEFTRDEYLYYGLLLMSQYEKNSNRGCLIEIDVLSGKRFVIRDVRRSPDRLPLNTATFQKLDLFGGEIKGYEEINALRKEAISVIASLDIKPTPSSACRGCAFGELCRNSKEFEDSGASDGG